MSMKKFDLAKNLGLKVAGQMKAAGVPGRFAQGAGEVLDKRERRARDAALGLVPFACKLPGDLARRLHERAVSHEGGLNGLMAELLGQAVEGGRAAVAEPADAETQPAAEAAAKPAAKKTPARKATTKASVKKATAGDGPAASEPGGSCRETPGKAVSRKPSPPGSPVPPVRHSAPTAGSTG